MEQVLRRESWIWKFKEGGEDPRLNGKIAHKMTEKELDSNMTGDRKLKSAHQKQGPV